MTNRIKLLSDQVASQIAAGEVVERPSSIIKELLENSIDAGSDNIVISLRKSGINYIKVTDNGNGIAKDDLVLAIAQHATSKITNLDDLNTIHSLGFRGEALASICCVSKLKITSKLRKLNEFSESSREQDLDEINEYNGAWTLETNGSNTEYEITPVAHSAGTSIEVRDLFFNVPVRRRFLKSPKTEYQHVLDIFQKIALSNFDCAFTLISDDKIIYKLPKASNKFAQNNRLKKIFGFSFIKNAIFFEGKAAGITLHGWMSNHSHHRSQADQQYFFLNNRVIRDKLIIHAIKYVYDGIIPNGRYPCYVLYLNLDPSSVDINVHPTKHEVRFCEPRWVHQFIVQQLSKVLIEEQQSSFDTMHDRPLQSNVINKSSESSNQEYYNKPREFNKSLEPIESKSIDAMFGISSNSDNKSKKHTENTYPKFANIIAKLNSKSSLRTSSGAITNISSYKLLEQEDANCNGIGSKRDLAVAIDSINSINMEFVENRDKNLNFGKIIVDFDNSLVISSYNKKYYLINLISVYKNLIYDQLYSQWNKHKLDNIAIEFYYSVIKPEISVSDILLDFRSNFNSDFNSDDKLSKSFLSKINHVIEFMRSLGFEVYCNYKQDCNLNPNFDSGLDSSSESRLEFTAEESGELINNLTICSVPQSCRHADIKKLFMAVFHYVILKSIDTNGLDINNLDVDKLFKIMAELSVCRLIGNLTRNEQLSILNALDKLANIDYNSSKLDGSRLFTELRAAELNQLLVLS